MPPSPAGDLYKVEPTLKCDDPGVCADPGFGSPRMPVALATGQGEVGGGLAAPLFDLDKRKDRSALGHKVDLAEGGARPPCQNTVAFKPQKICREPFRPTPAALGDDPLSGWGAFRALQPAPFRARTRA